MNDEVSINPTTVHVKRALDGDARSLSWVVERISPLMLLKARSYLRHPGIAGVDAADVVQDAWLATLPKLDRLVPRPDGRMTPVLIRFVAEVVRRTCLAAMKNPRLRSPAADIDHAIVDGAPALVARVVHAEAIGNVLGAIDGFAPEDRRIFVHRAVDGLEFAEIVACLELSASADQVRHRYNRLLGELHRSFPEWIADELTG